MIFEKNLRTFEIFHHENWNSNDLNDQFKPFIAQIWLIMPKKAKKWPFLYHNYGYKVIFFVTKRTTYAKKTKTYFFHSKNSKNIQKITYFLDIYT